MNLDLAKKCYHLGPQLIVVGKNDQGLLIIAIGEHTLMSIVHFTHGFQRIEQFLFQLNEIDFAVLSRMDQVQKL